MWTGCRFRLKSKILAISLSSEDRTADYISAGEIVKVIRGPKPTATRLVDITWNGSDYSVFAVDLEARGEQIRDSGAWA